MQKKLLEVFGIVTCAQSNILKALRTASDVSAAPRSRRWSRGNVLKLIQIYASVRIFLEIKCHKEKTYRHYVQF